jgi:hypothetical protein
MHFRLCELTGWAPRPPPRLIFDISRHFCLPPPPLLPPVQWSTGWHLNVSCEVSYNVVFSSNFFDKQIYNPNYILWALFKPFHLYTKAGVCTSWLLFFKFNSVASNSSFWLIPSHSREAFLCGPCVPVDRYWQVKQVGGSFATVQHGGQQVYRCIHCQLCCTFWHAGHCDDRQG